MRHFALCMLILPSACASVLSHSVRGVHDVHSIDTAEAHAATTAAHHATMRSSDAANNATDDDEWALLWSQNATLNQRSEPAGAAAAEDPSFYCRGT